MGNHIFFTGKMPVPRLKTSISQVPYYGIPSLTVALRRDRATAARCGRPTVGPSATMSCPSEMPHAIRNVGDKPLRYAIIKANYPRRK